MFLRLIMFHLEMKSRLLREVYSFNFSIIGILVFQSCKSEILIVQHPELPQYFENVSKFESQLDSDRPLAFLETDEKIFRCRESLTAAIYRSQSSDHDLPASNPDIRKLLNNVEDLYEREVLKGIQLIEITLQLPERVVLVLALPCILDVDFSWFITTGFQKNEFFILEKEATDKNFHIHGIAEPGPKMDESISFDQLEMEIHFLRNFRSAVHKTEKRHFCNLENIQKLRLCSSAHFAWREADGLHEIFQANSVHENASVCIENAVVWFEEITQENTGFTEPIQITLLSCAINSPLTEPQFYLAADQNNLNAAYILQKHDNENEEIVYQLFLRITNISPLRKEAKIIRTLFEYKMSE